MRIFSGLLHFSLPHSPYSHCTTQPKKIFLQFSWCSCAHRRRCRFTFDFFSPCFCSLAWCCCNHWAFYSSHSSPISSRRSQKKNFSSLLSCLLRACRRVSYYYFLSPLSPDSIKRGFFYVWSSILVW